MKKTLKKEKDPFVIKLLKFYTKYPKRILALILCIAFSVTGYSCDTWKFSFTKEKLTLPKVNPTQDK